MMNEKEDITAATACCPAFPNKEAAQIYQNNLAPPRDLICPITQELFVDPVVALGDGYTYERQSIQTWFQSQSSSTAGNSNNDTVAVRSPVSNAYMDNRQNQQLGLVENLVVAGLTRAFRERLGVDLCQRCECVFQYYTNCDNDEDRRKEEDVLGDGGFRIRCLVEAGADLALKGCSGGNTAFMKLIQIGQLDLINFFLLYDVPVTITNDEGLNPLQLIENYMDNMKKKKKNNNNNSASSAILAWHEVHSQIKSLHQAQLLKLETQNKARTLSNTQHRERQQSVQTQVQQRREQQQQQQQEQQQNNTTNQDGTINFNGNGLGIMQQYGWGYFPCLATLQFQGSVPEPSTSYMDYEMKERRRLEWILRSAGLCVFIFLMVC